MADNFPGPYEVEIFYTQDNLTHISRINTDVDGLPSPGDAPDTINLKTRIGGTVALTLAVSTWITTIKGFFANTTTFDSYNLWRYTAGTYKKTFITSGQIGEVGTSVNVATESHQATLTFRTQEGGSMRLVWLESAWGGKDRRPYAQLTAGLQGVFDQVVGTTN